MQAPAQARLLPTRLLRAVVTSGSFWFFCSFEVGVARRSEFARATPGSLAPKNRQTRLGGERHEPESGFRLMVLAAAGKAIGDYPGRQGWASLKSRGNP